MNTRALALIACSLLSSAARAEPTDAIKYLISHPPSMLDLGLLRLQAALERLVRAEDGPFALLGQRPSVIAYYDWDSNLIRIEFMDSLGKEHSLPAEEWERICRARIDRVRALFRGESGPKSPLAQQFTHIGWADTNRPFTLDAELRNMTLIRLFAQFSDAKSECSGRLVGTDVMTPVR